jgi:hypothetical protein
MGAWSKRGSIVMEAASRAVFFTQTPQVGLFKGNGSKVPLRFRVAASAEQGLGDLGVKK